MPVLVHCCSFFVHLSPLLSSFVHWPPVDLCPNGTPILLFVSNDPHLDLNSLEHVALSVGPTVTGLNVVGVLGHPSDTVLPICLSIFYINTAETHNTVQHNTGSKSHEGIFKNQISFGLLLSLTCYGLAKFPYTPFSNITLVTSLLTPHVFCA